MVPSPRDKLTNISMILAVLSAFSTLSVPVFLPFIFGSVALVLADLSRGGSERMSHKGKRASVIALVVIAINFLLFVVSAVYFYRVLRDPALQEQFSEILYRTYGITFEEFLSQFGR